MASLSKHKAELESKIEKIEIARRKTPVNPREQEVLVKRLQTFLAEKEGDIGAVEKALREIDGLRLQNQLVPIEDAMHQVDSEEEIENMIRQLDWICENTEMVDEQVDSFRERTDAIRRSLALRYEVVAEHEEVDGLDHLRQTVDQWEKPSAEEPELASLFLTNFPEQVARNMDSPASEDLLRDMDRLDVERGE